MASSIKRIHPTEVAGLVGIHRGFIEVALTSGERINLRDFEFRSLEAGNTLALQIFELG